MSISLYWTYNALTRSGQEITATLPGFKKDILQKISQQELYLIEIKPDYRRIFASFLFKKKLSTLSCAVFFEDFHNMLETGVSVVQILSIFKETSKDEALVLRISTLNEELSSGRSLTEALGGLNIFPWIVNVTLSAGERTGRLSEAVGILGQYFRRAYHVQGKIQQALVYPMIVFIVLLIVMFFISLRVIPQLKSLLPNEALHNQVTQGVLFLSFFLQKYTWILLVLVVLGILGVYSWGKKNRIEMQEWMYQWPVLGPVFKESTLVLYLLNLSVLLKSGVPLLEAIGDLNSFEQTPIATHFIQGREYMLGGASFWQAIEQDKFFPKIVSSTIRRAEEMAKIDEYCLILSDYFDKQTNSKVDGLIHTLQPVLLALGGVFLVVVALAFLLPIYGSLTAIAGGN